MSSPFVIIQQETNVENKNSTPVCDILKIRNTNNKWDVQEQEISSSHILLPSVTRERTQAISQIGKTIQITPETPAKIDKVVRKRPNSQINKAIQVIPETRVCTLF